jgi:hypothetical protein
MHMMPLKIPVSVDVAIEQRIHTYCIFLGKSNEHLVVG